MNVATQQLEGPTIPVSAANYDPTAAFSPDGKVLAVTGADSVGFWSVATGDQIGRPSMSPPRTGSPSARTARSLLS